MAQPRWRHGGARFVGAYRYRLWRQLSDDPRTVVFVMLNPSRASASHDDPTLRRCIGFTDSWGFGRLEVVNLFAYCATRVEALRATTDPVGPANPRTLRAACARADRLIVAWGVHGSLHGQEARWAPWMRRHGAYCLGTTRGGAPRHPLYVRASTAPAVW